MSKVLVLYYSSYGHLETMAQAMAEGARAGGATVDEAHGASRRRRAISSSRSR